MSTTKLGRFAIAIFVLCLTFLGVYLLARKNAPPPEHTGVSAQPTSAPVAYSMRITREFGCTKLGGECAKVDQEVPPGAELATDGSALVVVSDGELGEVALYGDSRLANAARGALLVKGAARVSEAKSGHKLEIGSGTQSLECVTATCSYLVTLAGGDAGDQAELALESGTLEWVRPAGNLRIAEGQGVRSTGETYALGRKYPSGAAPTVWYDGKGAAFKLSRAAARKPDEGALVLEGSRDRSFKRAEKLYESAEKSDGRLEFEAPGRSGIYYLRYRTGDVTGLPLLVVLTRNAPPEINEPIDQASIQKGKETSFSWKDETRAREFEVQIARDPEFKEIAKTLRVSGLEVKTALAAKHPNGSYHWRVRAVDPRRPEPPWSEAFSFDLSDAPVIAKPVILDGPTFAPDVPEILEVNAEGNLTLKWQPVEGARAYVVLMTTGDNQILYSKRVTTASGLVTLGSIPVGREFNSKGVTLKVATVNVEGKRGKYGSSKVVIYRPPSAGKGPGFQSVEVVD